MSQKSGGSIDLLFEAKGIPEFNPMGLLHGEQRLEVFHQLEADKEYIMKGRVVDVMDKKSGAVFVILSEVYDENTLVMRNYYYIFVKGLGGFDSAKTAPLLAHDLVRKVP